MADKVDCPVCRGEGTFAISPDLAARMNLAKVDVYSEKPDKNAFKKLLGLTAVVTLPITLATVLSVTATILGIPDSSEWFSFARGMVGLSIAAGAIVTIITSGLIIGGDFDGK